MKKLLLLSIIALFAFASANVYGQAGTGDQPSIGSTHTYWVNGTGTTTVQDATHLGSKYTWWISTSVGDLTSVASAGEFTTVTALDYNTPTDNLNKISLVWNPTSSGNTYFLVVKEEGVAPLCTNIKAFAIHPKNNFAVQFVLVDENNANADASSFCPPSIALSADGTTSAITYNYGTGVYLFKLHSTGLYSGWSFGNVLTNSSTTAITSVDYQIGSASWNPLTATGTVPANTTGSEDVSIRVTVNNGTTAGTYDEGLAQRLIKLALSDVKDGANNSAKITNNAGTVQTATPAQTQTVKARPSTTGISSN